jgi:hypothetical protein
MIMLLSNEEKRHSITQINSGKLLFPLISTETRCTSAYESEVCHRFVDAFRRYGRRRFFSSAHLALNCPILIDMHRLLLFLFDLSLIKKSARKLLDTRGHEAIFVKKKKKKAAVKTMP